MSTHEGHTAGSTTTTAASPALAKVQEDLADLIETFVHLGVQVHDYQGTQEAKLGLANHINRAVTSLSRVSKTTGAENVLVPPEVLAYVAEGRNPDVYTREFVEVVRKVNQHGHGRALALQRFHDELQAAVLKEFGE